MSDEREAYTVGRVALSDDVRRIVYGKMPKIKELVMSDMEPKRLTITGAHFDAGARDWKIVLSDGSILDGISACQVNAGSESITQIEMTSYIYKTK